MRTLAAVVLAGSLAAAIGAAPPSQDLPAVDRAFQAFFSASDRNGAAGRIEAILKTNVSFDGALSRIRQGRAYPSNAPRGVQFGRTRTFDGRDHPYAFVVPESYDHTRPYQLRVYLHGGVGRPRPTAANRIRTGSLPSGIDEIRVFPVSWADSLWWSATQVDNLGRILDQLKRTYNIDENRVYLTGTSDGGTGAFFVAFKDTTSWASFVPLIGDMTVLASPAVRVVDEMFPGNAVNKPLFIVNGGRDRLYPAHIVQLYVEHLQKLGTEIVFHVHPEADHSTAWWPEELGAFERFVHDHPREPLPDRVSWQTERTDRFNRAHWLVIDRLGAVDGENRLPDSNILRRGIEHDFGLRISAGVDQGRRVFAIVPGSNAARIGLRVGDTFLEIDSAAVRTGRDVVEGMQNWKIGAPLRFVVDRRGGRVVLEGIFEPVEVDVPPAPIFPRRKPSGRVDAVRRGNVVDAKTEGVRAFTLLLSPSVFDFGRPITVVANGRTAFHGMVEPSIATMLKWAARDNDRTMVFGAEVNIEVGR